MSFPAVICHAKHETVDPLQPVLRHSAEHLSAELARAREQLCELRAELASAQAELARANEQRNELLARVAELEQPSAT